MDSTFPSFPNFRGGVFALEELEEYKQQKRIYDQTIQANKIAETLLPVLIDWQIRSDSMDVDPGYAIKRAFEISDEFTSQQFSRVTEAIKNGSGN